MQAATDKQAALQARTPSEALLKRLIVERSIQGKRLHLQYHFSSDKRIM